MAGIMAQTQRWSGRFVPTEEERDLEVTNYRGRRRPFRAQCALFFGAEDEPMYALMCSDPTEAVRPDGQQGAHHFPRKGLADAANFREAALLSLSTLGVDTDGLLDKFVPPNTGAV